MEDTQTYNFMYVKGFSYDLLQDLALGNSHNAFCVLRQDKYCKKARIDYSLNTEIRFNLTD